LFESPIRPLRLKVKPLVHLPKTFPGKARRTADPSASLRDDKKERVVLRNERMLERRIGFSKERAGLSPLSVAA
jgi:hypothetical protein